MKSHTFKVVMLSVHIKKTTKKPLYFQSRCTKTIGVGTDINNRSRSFTPMIIKREGEIECRAKEFLDATLYHKYWT